MQLSNKQIKDFQDLIWNFYAISGRPFAWRNVGDPYKVVVSEIMLQQTQTYRVAPKYDLFLAELPNFYSLAQASLRDVLSLWQGLGYNRRGMALHNIGKKVVDEFNGQLPNDPEILVTFPGIGKATAASICAFAFNNPTVFIETNIRAVFIHCFFNDRIDVYDKEIEPLVAQTLDKANPREWYYALMDYGVMLKKTMPNPSRKSRHHTQQSKFQGSDRQIRGMILKYLVEFPKISQNALIASIPRDNERIEKILGDLCKEGLIKKVDNHIMIT